MVDDKEQEDVLHDLEGKSKASMVLPWRGFINVGVLIMLILGLLYLFIFYPILMFTQNNVHNLTIDGNIHINAMGQAPVL